VGARCNSHTKGSAKQVW